jgi:hypothetical protein
LAAARQLLRGRCPFRGEWERIPCFFLRRKQKPPHKKVKKLNMSKADDDAMNVEFLPANGAPAEEKKKRITTPYMTKYERARVIGTRALQIRLVSCLMQIGL